MGGDKAARVPTRYPQLRIPIGAFCFDAWGTQLAARLSDEDLDETIHALVHGYERPRDTVGYARALHAITQSKPEPRERITALAKASPRRRKIMETPRREFEARWSAAALAHLEDIPSLA